MIGYKDLGRVEEDFTMKILSEVQYPGKINGAWSDVCVHEVVHYASLDVTFMLVHYHFLT